MTENHNSPESGLEAYFGLPSHVEFCTKCTYSNQRPVATVEFKNTDKKEAVVLDERGVCSGCIEHEKKWGVYDYESRQKELEIILDQYRSKDGSYDVLVPGSGGKDSMYVSHVLEHKYGMHPLTVTWPPHMYTDVGKLNFDAWVRKHDNITVSPKGDVHRLLTREAFLYMLHPFQPFILGQKTVGPRIAQKFGIKLIMYGENGAEGGSPMPSDTPVMDPIFYATPRAKQKDIVIGKRTYKELLEMGLTESDLELYLPLAIEDMKEAEIQTLYMSYFENWRSQEKYYYSIDNFGFVPNYERTEGTFTKFCGLDDKIDGLQYYTTYIKFGIGRATYDSAQEIRHQYIDRDEGVALVEKYDGEFPKKFHEEILDYMSISEDQFWGVIDSHRSPHLWKKENNEWKLRHKLT
jgi:N-acetyl sugar amidotransferase